MTNRITRSVLALAFAGLTVLAACSSSSEVGTEVGAKGKGGGQGALRDAKATTTQALDIDNPAAPTTQAPASAGIGNTPATRDPAASTTTAPRTITTEPEEDTTTTQGVEEFTVKIQDDEQGHFMDPLQLQVPVGAKVTWKNVGTKTRQLQATGGQFNSPNIPAGESWTWTVNVPAQSITYKDTTRPYSSASLQVF